nr:hypothetical protein [Citricoccus sp. SGAir0253]
MSSRPATACREPEASTTTSKPAPAVISRVRSARDSVVGSTTCRAPKRPASSRRSAMGSIMVSAVAPWRCISCRTSCPMGPPPQTATRSPGRTRVLSAMRTATEVGSSRQPSSRDTPSGSRYTWDSCQTTERAMPGRLYSPRCSQNCWRPSWQGGQVPQNRTKLPETRSPTARSVRRTPGPSSATMPETSWPRPIGTSVPKNPSARCGSEPQIAA